MFQILESVNIAWMFKFKVFSSTYLYFKKNSNTLKKKGEAVDQSKVR